MYSKMEWVKEQFGLVGQVIWQILIDIAEIGIETFDGLFARNQRNSRWNHKDI